MSDQLGSERRGANGLFLFTTRNASKRQNVLDVDPGAWMFTQSPRLNTWQKFSYKRVRFKRTHGSVRVGPSNEALAALQRTVTLTAEALSGMSVQFISNCVAYPEPFTPQTAKRSRVDNSRRFRREYHELLLNCTWSPLEPPYRLFENGKNIYPNSIVYMRVANHAIPRVRPAAESSKVTSFGSWRKPGNSEFFLWRSTNGVWCVTDQPGGGNSAAKNRWWEMGSWISSKDNTQPSRGSLGPTYVTQVPAGAWTYRMYETCDISSDHTLTGCDNNFACGSEKGRRIVSGSVDPTFTCVFVDDQANYLLDTVIVQECQNTRARGHPNSHELDKHKQGHTWLLRTQRHSVFKVNKFGIFYLPEGTKTASTSMVVAQGIVVICEQKPSLEDFQKFDHLSEHEIGSIIRSEWTEPLLDNRTTYFSIDSKTGYTEVELPDCPLGHIFSDCGEYLLVKVFRAHPSFNLLGNDLSDAEPTLCNFQVRGKHVGARVVRGIVGAAEANEIEMQRRMAANAIAQKQQASLRRRLLDAAQEIVKSAKANADEQAETKADPEGKAEVETKNEAEAQVETEAEAQPEVETKNEAEAQPEVETKNEAEAQVETEAEAQPEVETKNESEAQVETEAEAQPEVETEVASINDVDMGKSAADTNSNLPIRRKEIDEANTSAQETTIIDSSDSVSVTANMDWRSKTMLLLHMMQKTVRKTKAGTEAGGETKLKIKAKAGADADAEAKTEARAEAKSKTGAETNEATAKTEGESVMELVQNPVDSKSLGGGPKE